MKNRRNHIMKKLNVALLIFFAFFLSACTISENDLIEPEQNSISVLQEINEDGQYVEASDVAKYLRAYSHLPKNYLTKQEAKEKGWIASEGNLREITNNAVIGGDRFGNREGLLPEEPGRTYYECDVNYDGGHRGPERLVYSDDGLIFYTKDHYKSFIDVTEEGPS